MTAATGELPLRYRPMRQADLPAVTALEARAYDYPWSGGVFRDCLLAGYIAEVVEQSGEVRGYSIMSVAAGEAHLLNICLAAPLRGGGEGERLLQHMLDLARVAGADRLFLEVRPSNASALRLYERNGFTMLGVRKAYYRARNGKEDALVLVRSLSGRPVVLGEKPLSRA
ncbi:MAG: ribosomal protein S18-alanine N-acetyltransferase [Chromatiales bacterium]|nr:ribosomal protein S18-alanine N-acetyltransferase [Chromatiales bacterium]